MVTAFAETCRDCGQRFNYEPCIVQGREMFRPTRCDACCRAAEAASVASEAKAMDEAQDRVWERICPPLYRDTDPARLPGEFRAVIAGWKYGPRGVGFFGVAGMCKTRAAFELLRLQYYSGRACAAVSATKFSREAVDQFSDAPDRRLEARRRLEEFRTVRLLLIDDLGKGKMTDRAELELFDVLEERTSHELPTIWTANASAKELRAMMSADRGDPIMRRLKEFSDVVTAQP